LNDARDAVGPNQAKGALTSRVHEEAEKRGLTSVWLLDNEPEHLVGLISMARRIPQPDSAPPDDASLHALESSPSLGAMFEDLGCVKAFDRTSGVLTIWFPIAEGEPDVPPLWPNSPPMPAPAAAVAAR